MTSLLQRQQDPREQEIYFTAYRAAEEQTLRRVAMKIDGMVRDITAVSVAPAAKSEVRRIIEVALEELSERKEA